MSVVGMRSSGRTTLAREVVRELQAHEWRVLEVGGLAGVRDYPLAPLAIAGLKWPPGPMSAPVSAAAVAAVEKALVGPSVLVVDDADDLDPPTAAVLLAARRRRRVPMVAISRLGGGRERSYLIGDGLSGALRVESAPLRYDEVNALVTGLVDGTVHPATMARIATATGGLPGLVVAMVHAARLSGLLVKQAGVWSAPPQIWTPLLEQPIEALLSDLDDEAVEWLSTLALRGTVSGEEAAELVSWPALARLDDAGLLRVRHSGTRPIIAVFPPLLVDYFGSRRASIGPLRVEQQPSNASSERVPEPRVEAAASGRWPLPSYDAHTVLSLQAQRHWSGEVIQAKTRWEAAPTTSAAVRYARALLRSAADPALIRQVIERTPERSDDGEPDRALLTVLAADLAAVDGDLDRVRADLRPQQTTTPRFTALLRATEAHLQLVLGTVPGDDPLLGAAGEAEDPLSAQALAVARAEVLLARCRPVEALRELEGLDEVHDPEVVVARDLAHGLGLLFSGDLRGGFRWATERLEEARDVLDLGALTGFSFVISLSLTLAGRFGELDAHLADSLPIGGTPLTYRHFESGNLVLAALNAARQERWDYASALSSQAATLGTQTGPYPGMVPDLAHHLVEAAEASGSHPDAADVLWEYVEDQLERGLVLHAVWVAVWAAEHAPNDAVASRLQELVAAGSSLPAQLLVDYILALAAHDATELVRVGRTLRRHHYALYGFRATLAAVNLLREHGDAAGAAAAALEVWHELADGDYHLGSLFQPLAERIGLTAREREIAEDVASGLTNVAIADRRRLSVRTVENHLRSAFRKVGVGNREDLSTAITTWLSHRDDEGTDALITASPAARSRTPSTARTCGRQ